jgi:chemotaxis protein methyltransferase CheR
MFRDPDFYLAVRQVAIPVLRTYPFIRIWHAGCASGEEVYSMAILLKESGLYERTRLYATDMSEQALERARAGVFPLKPMKDVVRNYRLSGGECDFTQYCTTDSERVAFRVGLRTNMVLAQHNLASDHAFNEFHLIMCRNVMIYFNRALRERVHALLDGSLVRFGFLGLGKKESMDYRTVASQYQEQRPGTRLYRRL